ncbi:hypothetical protein [Simkania negevensis]|uniref:PI3K/PI4K catalytic domain-containing protein n=1 Tax=Simkania negevensis (strain ATCC VR-1471 / DSM 27360 / Z) TaxID=331113 RepID=F8L6X8_SIMNZ|nr:hypothetical protein [Simkania negevensis]CCB88486.1 unknown protein [Simkania negevensis Z]
MARLKLPVIYLIFVSALFLKTLTLIPPSTPYQFQSAVLVEKIPIPKWKKRFTHLIKQARHLHEKATVDRLISHTLTLFRDLSGLRTNHFLEAKWKALHQFIATLYFYERHSLTVEEVTKSKKKPCLRLKKGSKEWGYLKPRGNLYLEQACWDISLLLEMETLIAPSFPVMIEGKPYVFQPFLPIRTYQTIFTFPEKLSKRTTKISELNYWKANLLMTLFGPKDLHAGNIGFTKNHSLLFFDNEHIFSQTNTFLSISLKLTPPCINHLIDWPAAKNPLTKSHANHIAKLMESWRKKRSQLLAYLDHPSVSNFLTEPERQAFFDRFDELTKISIQSEVTTFESIITQLYPNLYEGLEDLKPIIEQITKQSISPMSSLQFVTSHRHWWKEIDTSAEEKMRIWVEKYHSYHKE